MIDAATRKKYTPTIGIECHVQLKTLTKLFAAVDNDAREAAPNSLISPICVGMPGALPFLNAEAVTLAMRAAFALNTVPQSFSKFDRKHYFYPDLPKGYQITQLEEPIILGGFVDITLPDGTSKKIGVTRAHMEEDAGKSTHPAGTDYSLVDLNRAGTPLLEIVSEPDMHSPEEAKAYASELWLLMRYADVSYANLYYGNMRFDVNVSVSADPNKLGKRAEIKNLNSFRSVEKAAEFEINRQIELLEAGESIVQETRGWDDAKQRTFSQRTKEDAHDYRYFPDADLPPIVITPEQIAAAKAQMGLLPADYRRKFAVLKLDSSQLETLIESETGAKLLLEILEKHGEKIAKTVANWLTGELQRLVVAGDVTWETHKLTVESLVALSTMVADAQLSSTGAKEVLTELILKDGDPKAIAETKNLIQVSDTGALEEIVKTVLAANEKAAQDVKNGEMKAIGFLVGQVMKTSQGKANPGMVQELIKKQLQ